MNTSRLSTCYTAGQFARTYKQLVEEGVEQYGANTREFQAFKTLLDHDASKLVDAQIRHLNEMLQRYSRECAEWLAQLPAAPVGLL